MFSRCGGGPNRHAGSSRPRPAGIAAVCSSSPPVGCPSRGCRRSPGWRASRDPCSTPPRGMTAWISPASASAWSAREHPQFRSCRASPASPKASCSSRERRPTSFLAPTVCTPRPRSSTLPGSGAIERLRSQLFWDAEAGFAQRVGVPHALASLREPPTSTTTHHPRRQPSRLHRPLRPHPSRIDHPNLLH